MSHSSTSKSSLNYIELIINAPWDSMVANGRKVVPTNVHSSESLPAAALEATKIIFPARLLSRCAGKRALALAPPRGCWMKQQVCAYWGRNSYYNWCRMIGDILSLYRINRDKPHPSDTPEIDKIWLSWKLSQESWVKCSQMMCIISA